MADNLKITRRTIQRHLNALKEHVVIERIGSDRTGYWKILKQ